MTAENATLLVRVGELEVVAARVVELEGTATRVVELEGQVAALSAKVAQLARLAFGDPSEKAKRPAPSGPGGPGDGPGPPPPRRKRGQQQGSPGHGRRNYDHLDTEEVVHDVAEEDRCCPRCAAPYVAFGEETCEQIEWQVRLVRVVHRRPTYRRSCRCPGVRGVLVAPPPPKAIAKGRFGLSFLSRLVVEKYVLGRPLHRVATALAHDGLDVAEGTMVGLLRATSKLLGPLDAAIRARSAAAGHVHVDETSWKVFETVAGKANNRWWCWVFVGPDTTVFRIEASRSTAVLIEHFGIDVDAGALAEGRRLLISSDFFTVYQSLSRVEGVEPLWCFAHIRRYFLRAGDAHGELKAWAEAWRERIGVLYVAHGALGAAEVGSAGATRAGAEMALAIEEMDVARRAEAADPGLHPAAAKVLATLDHEWEGLARHLSFPEVALDNNAAERALRNPVVGRKNYYGSGSVWAAECSGRAWSITATAERAGLNPLTYLHAYLGACAGAGATAPTGAALERFFPWSAGPEDLAAWAAPLAPDTS